MVVRGRGEDMAAKASIGPVLKALCVSDTAVIPILQTRKLRPRGGEISCISEDSDPGTITLHGL